MLGGFTAGATNFTNLGSRLDTNSTCAPHVRFQLRRVNVRGLLVQCIGVQGSPGRCERCVPGSGPGCQCCCQQRGVAVALALVPLPVWTDFSYAMLTASSAQFYMIYSIAFVIIITCEYLKLPRLVDRSLIYSHTGPGGGVVVPWAMHV